MRELLRWSHVIVGFAGLLAFWFPVFSRKGGALHRLAGKIFVYSGYWVCASAGLSCAVIGLSLYRRGGLAERGDAVATLVFLAYLAWVTFVMLRYAVGVLGTKKDPTLLATVPNRLLAYSAVMASGALVVFAMLRPSGQSILLYALSPIGVGTGLPMLKYMRGNVASKRAWFYEHMSATLGAGIAFHTAFAVFGASRLFAMPSQGLLAILPWILPTAVGTPAIILWQRHYRRKLGDLPRSAEAVVGDPARA